MKELKPAAVRLLEPLLRAAAACSADKDDGVPRVEQEHENFDRDVDADAAAEIMLKVYSEPERYSGLHDYAKALELLENSILGGFYYRHFSLAVNVIGSASRGTMNRSVAALTSAYETRLFPCLDAARTKLGLAIDAQLLANKVCASRLDLEL